MKINKYNRKFTYWINKTRSKKARSYIKLKNLVSTEEATKQRHFYTDHLLNEKDGEYPCVDKTHWWLDLYFMSKKHKMYYNVALITRKMAAMDAIDEACDSFDTPNKPKVLFTFKPVGDGLNEMITPPDATNWWNEVSKNKAQKIRNLIANGKVVVKNSTSLDFKYKSGVGLHATLDVDDLTEDVINKWIEDFWANGETISPGYDIHITSDSIAEMYANILAK